MKIKADINHNRIDKRIEALDLEPPETSIFYLNQGLRVVVYCCALSYKWGRNKQYCLYHLNRHGSEGLCGQRAMLLFLLQAYPYTSSNAPSVYCTVLEVERRCDGQEHSSYVLFAFGGQHDVPYCHVLFYNTDEHEQDALHDDFDSHHDQQRELHQDDLVDISYGTPRYLYDAHNGISSFSQVFLRGAHDGISYFEQKTLRDDHNNIFSFEQKFHHDVHDSIFYHNIAAHHDVHDNTLYSLCSSLLDDFDNIIYFAPSLDHDEHNSSLSYRELLSYAESRPYDDVLYYNSCFSHSSLHDEHGSNQDSWPQALRDYHDNAFYQLLSHIPYTDHEDVKGQPCSCIHENAQQLQGVYDHIVRYIAFEGCLDVKYPYGKNSPFFSSRLRMLAHRWGIIMFNFQLIKELLLFITIKLIASNIFQYINVHKGEFNIIVIEKWRG